MPTTRPAAEHSTTTSFRLIARARSGERTAFGRLIARCIPELARWAHHRLPQWARTAADTTDIVHDAVLRTLGQQRSINLPSRQALAAYLREAVHNRIRDEHRRIGRRGVHDAIPETLVEPGPSPFDRTLTCELDGRYRAALARLKDRDRELIVAHIELGYSHEQLGLMTGRSRNAARMALERAVRRLAEQMRDG